MGTAERYLSEIGGRCRDAMKLLTAVILMKSPQDLGTSSGNARLAAAVANRLFLDPAPDPLHRQFAADHEADVLCVIARLAFDGEYCSVLSGAMYNTCYGRYVDTGHRIGLLVHPYLGFVRALNAFAAGAEPLTLALAFIPHVGDAASAPLLQLCRLGLYRALPNSPDSNAIAARIEQFSVARGYGAVFQGQ
jgi:hypothetical protein